MYKIREVAKLLNVETIDIHKKLISLKSDLAGHVFKERGITRIDDRGIEIISRNFLSSDITDITLTEEKDILVETVEKKEFPSSDEIIQIDVEELEESSLLKIKSSINELKTLIGNLDQEIYRETNRVKEYSEQLNLALKELDLLIKK